MGSGSLPTRPPESTRRRPARRAADAYAAFISYSHAADGKLAPALQSGLHGFARPWFRLRALRVFRDEASLSANPGLWSSIQQALDRSEFFILLAAPEAARSDWVRREVSYWLEHKSLATFLIVLTDGELAWNHALGDFDWSRTTALPSSLQGVFPEGPHYIDLRWARVAEDVSLRNPRFRNAIADVAAPLHHRSKDELIGEDVRQHKRTIRWVRSAVATLVVLTLLAGLSAVIAVSQRNTARTERDTALSRQLSAQSQMDMIDELPRSVLLSLEALSLRDTPEARGALLTALERKPGLRHDVETGPNPLTALAWSPTGRWLAWGETYGDGTDGGIVLWDVANARREGPTLPTRGQAGALAFSPDGRRLVSGNSDGSVRVWDLTPSGPEQTREMTHGGQVSAVAFSPNGDLVASGGNGEVLLWSMASQQRVGPAMPGSDVAFGPDGRTLAVASGDQVALWDIRRGALTDSATSPAEGVQDVLFDAAGTTLASSSIDGLVVLWDLGPLRPRGEPLNGYETMRQGELGPSASDFPYRVIGAGDKDFHSIAFSPDGTLLASGGIDDSVVFWDVPARELLGAYPTNWQELVYGIAFDPEGDRVATATSRGDVLVWDVGTERRLSWSPGSHPAWVNAVAVSRDGQTVVSGDRDGRITVWDVSGGTAVGDPLQHPGDVGGVMGLALSPDGRTLVSSGGRVVLWDLDSHERTGDLGHSSGTVGVAFSPDGSTVASANGDTVQVWDVRRGSMTPLAGHQAAVNVVHYSPDGRTLGSAGSDGRILLWDLERGERMGELVAGEDERIWSLALSPDGRTIASGGGVRSGDITLWDIETGNRTAVLTGHDDLVSGLAFTPDGTMLVSSSHDGSIFLWDVDDRARIGPSLRGHGSNVVQAVALSRDGTTMASGGTDGRVVLWDLRLDKWIDWACELAARNLSQVEWDRFLPGRSYQRTCPDLPSGAGAPVDAPASMPR
ncbi:toll/interleukin-1 receptor domain-containing protein [Geodermatophilus sp. SYSU D00697]